MDVLKRKEGVSYRHYYRYPFPPDKKKPVVMTKDKTIVEIYPPDKPYSSNIVCSFFPINRPPTQKIYIFSWAPRIFKFTLLLALDSSNVSIIRFWLFL